MSRILFRSVLPAACLALLPALFARADGPAAGKGLEHARFDLSALKAPPAAAAARIYAASDSAFPGFDASEVSPDAVVLKFQDPVFPDQVAPADVVEDLVRRFVPETGEGPGSARAVGSGIEAWASPPALERARAIVAYAASALAPRLSVRASLTTTAEAGGEERLVAAGAADLPARRWTPLWFRRSVRRFVTGYRAQVAQEAVVAEPMVSALPEGTECYLRWSPGETVSLVEVWVGALEHGPTFDVDLSPLRSVPESNAMGTATLPKTWVSRAFFAMPVPAAKSSKAEAQWDAAPRALRLRLDVGASAPAPTADFGGTPYAVVRAAAAGGALDGGLRAARVEEVVRLFQTADASGSSPAGHLETISQTFLGCEGAEGRADRLRAEVARSEEALAAADVTVRCVAVPGPALQGILSGQVGIGRALEPAALDALASGAQPLSAARVPLTSGIAASVRAGASVTGFGLVSASVAERAGGIAPTPVARFEGFAADVKATRAQDGGWRLRVVGDLSWAKPDGGSSDLAFRPPIGMTFRNYNSNPEDPAVRRVKVPLLSEGQASCEAEATFSAEDAAAGKTAVLAILSHPGADGHPEAVVVLASVRAAPR